MQQSDNTPFSEAVNEALKQQPATQTPLLPQEVIEDEDPPRINLTAVICTAIVAVTVAIILLVAQPWKNNDSTPLVEDQLVSVDSSFSQGDGSEKTDKKIAEEKRTAEEVAAKEKRKAEEKAAKEKQEAEKKQNTQLGENQKVSTVEPSETLKPQVSSLPVVKTTPTGTGNIYNSIRLIDASSRLLTKAEVEQMSKEELALARNSIYARHGYQFNNPDLKEFFAKQSWFTATDVKIDAIPFTQIELDNIRLIKSYENKL